MNNKIIFFDIGGTLIDAPDLFTYCSEKLLHTKNDAFISSLRNTFQEIHNNHYCGHNFLNVGNILDLSISALEGLYIFKNYKWIWDKLYHDLYINHSFLKNSVIETLAEIKKLWWTPIVTSDSDKDILLKELELHNIKGYFHDFYISSQLWGYKPSREFIEVLEKIIISKDTTYVIWDSIVDRKLAAGLWVPFIYFQNNSEIPLKQNEINNLKQLLAILQ